MQGYIVLKIETGKCIWLTVSPLPRCSEISPNQPVAIKVMHGKHINVDTSTDTRAKQNHQHRDDYWDKGARIEE